MTDEDIERRAAPGRPRVHRVAPPRRVRGPRGGRSGDAAEAIAAASGLSREAVDAFMRHIFDATEVGLRRATPGALRIRWVRIPRSLETATGYRVVPAGPRAEAARAAVRTRSVFWPAVQAAIAAALAWWIAHHLLGHSQPFFAPIAAVLALSTSYTMRSRRALQMLAGVLLGIASASCSHRRWGRTGSRSA